MLADGVLRLISEYGTAQLLSCALECPCVCAAACSAQGPSFAVVPHRLVRHPPHHCLRQLYAVAVSPSLSPGVVVVVTSISWLATHNGNMLVPTLFQC